MQGAPTLVLRAEQLPPPLPPPPLDVLQQRETVLCSPLNDSCSRITSSLYCCCCHCSKFTLMERMHPDQELVSHTCSAVMMVL
jgi:L-asparaginase II